MASAAALASSVALKPGQRVLVVNGGSSHIVSVSNVNAHRVLVKWHGTTKAYDAAAVFPYYCRGAFGSRHRPHALTAEEYEQSNKTRNRCADSFLTGITFEKNTVLLSNPGSNINLQGGTSKNNGWQVQIKGNNHCRVFESEDHAQQFLKRFPTDFFFGTSAVTLFHSTGNPEWRDRKTLRKRGRERASRKRTRSKRAATQGGGSAQVGLSALANPKRIKAGIALTPLSAANPAMPTALRMPSFASPFPFATAAGVGGTTPTLTGTNTPNIVSTNGTPMLLSAPLVGGLGTPGMHAATSLGAQLGYPPSPALFASLGMAPSRLDSAATGARGGQSIANSTSTSSGGSSSGNSSSGSSNTLGNGAVHCTGEASPMSPFQTPMVPVLSPFLSSFLSSFSSPGSGATASPLQPNGVTVGGRKLSAFSASPPSSASGSPSAAKSATASSSASASAPVASTSATLKRSPSRPVAPQTVVTPSMFLANSPAASSALFERPQQLMEMLVASPQLQAALGSPQQQQQQLALQQIGLLLAQSMGGPGLAGNAAGGPWQLTPACTTSVSVSNRTDDPSKGDQTQANGATAAATSASAVKGKSGVSHMFSPALLSSPGQGYTVPSPFVNAAGAFVGLSGSSPFVSSVSQSAASSSTSS